jgi:hypothetical protein
MVTAVDVKSGYGQKKAQPYNSIIPYLRSKQIRVEHNPVVKSGGRKPQATPPEKGGGSGESDLVKMLVAIGKEDPEKAGRLADELQEVGALTDADHVRLACNGL